MRVNISIRITVPLLCERGYGLGIWHIVRVGLSLALGAGCKYGYG